MFGLVFLVEDLVRGDVILVAIVVSGLFLIFLPFDISCIGLVVLCVICAS
jgi:hypothetical protein